MQTFSAADGAPASCSAVFSSAASIAAIGLLFPLTDPNGRATGGWRKSMFQGGRGGNCAIRPGRAVEKVNAAFSQSSPVRCQASPTSSKTRSPSAGRSRRLYRGTKPAAGTRYVTAMRPFAGGSSSIRTAFSCFGRGLRILSNSCLAARIFLSSFRIFPSWSKTMPSISRSRSRYRESAPSTSAAVSRDGCLFPFPVSSSPPE